MPILEAATLSSIIADIGSVFTAAIGWVGTVGETVTGTPILMIFAGLPLVGLGVGLFRRLLNVN